MPRPAIRTALTGVLTIAVLAGCGNDKAKHAAAGAGIAVVTTELTGSPLKGCLAALGAGLAKEAWDSTGRGQVEGADVLATTIGCGVTLRF